LDDSWKKWTEPKNLGPGINSEHDENYLSITADFKFIYFESYPTGADDKDIYRAILPGQFYPENMAPALNTDIVIADATDPDSGASPTSVQDGETSEARQNKAANARPVKLRPVDAQILSTREYFQDGQIMSKVLRNNYFPFDSYQLTANGFSRLDEITKILQNNPGMQAQVDGHADSWGTDDVNLRISYLRAQAAAHYLIDQGIPGNRLMVTGNGDQHPLASNDDEEEGRELNRRVEVTLIGQATAHKFTIY
jgi:outer membrane protein OmpA-like peptidoglycan-associated protein